VAEVEIPYVGGPLGMQGERELLQDWELEEGAPGAVEGYVFEYRPAGLFEGADPNEVHRYVLTRRRGRWEFWHEDDLRAAELWEQAGGDLNRYRELVAKDQTRDGGAAG
jgi:hypothetical protein